MFTCIWIYLNISISYFVSLRLFQTGFNICQAPVYYIFPEIFVTLWIIAFQLKLWVFFLYHQYSSGPYTQSIIRFFFLYIKLMCPYFILLIYTDGERDGLWMACPFRTLVVLYRMFPFIICLILMNYLMEFYFIGFVNAHLPGCFCPWTFRLNIGLNTSPSDSFVSYLNSHLGYSAGEFQALQLIVLAVFGAVD